MKIRAHHLLCMQGFQGYGYNEDFSKNMAEIIESLKSCPNQEIEIVTECDIICSCCPHNINEKCKDLISNWKITSMDRKILKKLGFKAGVQESAKNIFYLVNERFRTFNDVKEICENCRWSEKCLWFLEKPRNIEF